MTLESKHIEQANEVKVLEQGKGEARHEQNRGRDPLLGVTHGI